MIDDTYLCVHILSRYTVNACSLCRISAGPYPDQKERRVAVFNIV